MVVNNKKTELSKDDRIIAHMNTQQFHDCTHKIYASLSKTKIQALKWEVGIKSYL